MRSVRSFYFADGPYLTALRTLYGALQTPESFATLTGAPGSGKSRLCRILRKIRKLKQQPTLYLARSIESPEMLRGALARALRLPPSANFQRQLETSLAGHAGSPLLLILDDAHLFDDSIMLEIKRLLEVQLQNRRLLNLLLCGEPSLKKRLCNDVSLQQLSSNITCSQQLEPMSRTQLENFLAQYFDWTGAPRLSLEPSVLRTLYRTCRGYPGPASEICRLIKERSEADASSSSLGTAELSALLERAPPGLLPASGGLWATSRHAALLPFAAAALLACLALLTTQFGSG